MNGSSSILNGLAFDRRECEVPRGIFSDWAIALWLSRAHETQTVNLQIGHIMKHRNDFDKPTELTPLAFIAEALMFVAVLGGLLACVTLLHVAFR